MRFLIRESAKAAKLQGLIAILKNFAESINLNIGITGLYVQGMDKTHCCLFELNLRAEWFDEYDVGTCNCKTIGFSNLALHKMLNTRRENQAIEVVHCCDKNHIDIGLTSPSGETAKNYNKQFELPIMDLEMELFTIPDIDADSDLTVNSSVFKDIIDELAVFSEKINIVLDSETIKFNTVAGDEGRMMITLKNDDITEYSIIDDETISQTFNLKILKAVCGFNKISDEIKLSFSNDKPLFIRINLDGNDNSNYISFHLAPYIDDDGDE